MVVPARTHKSVWPRVWTYCPYSTTDHTTLSTLSQKMWGQPYICNIIRRLSLKKHRHYKRHFCRFWTISYCVIITQKFETWCWNGSAIFTVAEKFKQRAYIKVCLRLWKYATEAVNFFIIRLTVFKSETCFLFSSMQILVECCFKMMSI